MSYDIIGLTGALIVLTQRQVRVSPYSDCIIRKITGNNEGTLWTEVRIIAVTYDQGRRRFGYSINEQFYPMIL